MRIHKVQVLSIFAFCFVGGVYAFPNDHTHEPLPDFRVSCDSWGWGNQTEPSRADLIWDSKNKKMIITGDSIDGDDGLLVEENGAFSTKRVKYATTFWEGEKKYNRPNIKTVYMTFSEERSSSHYHGGDYTKIRTFKFQVRQGEPGSIITSSGVLAEGILDMGYSGRLSDCTFSGIYASP